MAVLRGAPSSIPIRTAQWGSQAQAVQFMVQGKRDRWIVNTMVAWGHDPYAMTTTQFYQGAMAIRMAMGGPSPARLNGSQTPLADPILGEHASTETYHGSMHADKGSATERHIDDVLFMEETFRKSVGAYRFYGAAPGERSKLPVGMLHL